MELLKKRFGKDEFMFHYIRLQNGRHIKTHSNILRHTAYSRLKNYQKQLEVDRAAKHILIVFTETPCTFEANY